MDYDFRVTKARLRRQRRGRSAPPVVHRFDAPQPLPPRRSHGPSQAAASSSAAATAARPFAELTSVEVNHLVYRYLLESGFLHTGFSFGYESHLNDSNVDSSEFPFNALSVFIQKGFQYVEMEANMESSGEDADDCLVTLDLLDIIMNPLPDLENVIREERKKAKEGVCNWPNDRTTVGSLAELTSAEVNLLIFRYFQESGFPHAAFNFELESKINMYYIGPNALLAGALVRFVRNGLAYVEMEANSPNVSDADADADADDYYLLHPLDIITKPLPVLQDIIKEKRRKAQEDGNHEKMQGAVDSTV